MAAGITLVDPGAADRDHHRRGGGCERCRVPCARAPTGSVPPGQRWSARRSCPTRYPASSPARCWPWLAPSARRRRFYLVGAITGLAPGQGGPARSQPAAGALHRPTGGDRRVVQATAGGVQRDRRRRHHGDAPHRAGHEHHRHPVAHALREEEVLPCPVRRRPHVCVEARSRWNWKR